MAYHPMNPGSLAQTSASYTQTSRNQAPSTRVISAQPQLPKRQASFVRVPRNTSQALASLVSRFEALDALSLPTGTSCLQPAPLQRPKPLTLPRPRDASGLPTQRQWSTIFSPRPQSQNKYKPFFPGDGAGSQTGERFSTPAHKPVSPVKKSPSRFLVLSPSTNKTSDSRLRNIIHQSSPRSPLERYGNPTSPRRDRKTQARKSKDMGVAVKDRINQFDGNKSNSIAKRIAYFESPKDTPLTLATVVSKALSTRVNPSLRSSPQATPPIRRWTNAGVQPSVTSSRGRPRSNISLMLPPPAMSWKSCESLPSKERGGMTFGQCFPNPFVYGTPLSKSSTFMTSPAHSVISGATPRSIASKQIVSPIMSRYSDRGRRKKLRSSRASLTGGKSPQRSTSRSPARRSKVSPDKKSLGSQIETLYHAKCKARQLDLCQDTPHERAQASTASTALKKCLLESGRQASQYDGSSMRKGLTKVAGMKALFDGGASSKGVDEHPPVPKAFKAKFWTPRKGEHALRDTSETQVTLTVRNPSPSPNAALPDPPCTPPQTPPPISPKNASRSRTTSHETIEPAPLRIVAKLPTAAAQAEPAQRIIVAEKLIVAQKPRVKSGGIGDKIKLFENRAASNTKPEAQTLFRIESKKVGDTGKREESMQMSTWVKKAGHHLERRDLSGSAINKIVGEILQDLEVNPLRTAKSAGRPDFMPFLLQPLEGGATEEKENEMLDVSSGELVKAMFVECGLKQPKPMRLLEMKRMVMLCRGKVIGPTLKKF